MRRLSALVIAGCAAAALARPAAAQQRPLVTQDPETIGAGRALVEAGIDYSHDAFFPLSGLKGNLTQVPVLGINVGLSSIADLQIYGGPYQVLSITERRDAPLAGAMTFTGDSTHSVVDLVIGTKIRILPETPGRPSFGFRFTTQLPNAKHESGLGQDTTNFHASLLTGKTIQSVRVVGNIGFAIMPEPLTADKQNDVLTYGLSFARAMTPQVDLVGEVNGRASTRGGKAPVGTESRSELKLGGRFTRGALRADAGIYFGLTSVDPTVGFTAGLTYVFNAFTVP